MRRIADSQPHFIQGTVTLVTMPLALITVAAPAQTTSRFAVRLAAQGSIRRLRLGEVPTFSRSLDHRFIAYSSPSQLI